MENTLSIVLGFILAWTILFFIGPRPTVSYYVQAPIQPVELSELDKIMTAVGLEPSDEFESIAEIAIMSSSPAPVSVDEMMVGSPAPVSVDEMPSPSPAPSEF